MMIEAIDLKFKGKSNLIAAFLVRGQGGKHALVETGPDSCFKELEKGLSLRGVKLRDIEAVFLSHIHFDHAGAAWRFAESGAQIYVHPEGHRHMLDPARLVSSAARIYGDQMDVLWGRMESIAPERLTSVADNQSISAAGYDFIARFTPGHAKHHIAWQLGDNVFAGDVGGCRILNGPVVLPTPPPDFDAEQWHASVKLIRELKPKKLWVTHWGESSHPAAHLDELEQQLDVLMHLSKSCFKAKGSVDAQMLESFFRSYTLAYGLDEDTLDKYASISPNWMNAQGLSRYWSKMLAAT